MKNFNLVLFTVLFSVVLGLVFMKPMLKYEPVTSYKIKNKMPQHQRADGWAQIRAQQLANINTGKVEASDWYKAFADINTFPKSELSSRAGELKWENQGPDQVGGRTRSFIFDNTKDGRVYTAGVQGGVFVSDNLGNNWRPVMDMNDSFPVLSIGCMTQSKDGDIYAGSGEYWSNNSFRTTAAVSNGNGIYKKNKDNESWTLLRSTVTGNLIGQGNGNFQQVIDIASDRTDNEKVYAATNNGLYISTNGGSTWTKNAGFTSAVTQIKVAIDGTLYAGNQGHIHKSTNGGTSWTNLTSSNTAYKSDGNGHMCITLSSQDPKVFYACGITSNSDLKYVIRTKDAGATFEMLGKGDMSFNPLCNDVNGQRSCQGWYDLALAVHPKNDDLIFLGGAPSMFSWSTQYGWLQMSSGYAPAVLGINQVHADFHGFAFHPTNADTMVAFTDGGPHISFNSTKSFPAVTWKPIVTKYNVTQFYDVAVNKYGELLGGTQDNGSQFVTLNALNTNYTFELQGGDGFDSDISAANDYQVAFTSTYSGGIRRTSNLTTNNKAVASGCVASGANMGNTGFYTRFHLAESVIKVPEKNDSLEVSILLAFDQGTSFAASPNAYKVTEPTKWSLWANAGVGLILSAHQSKNLSALYICGTSGVRKTTALRNPAIWIDDLTAADKPCMKPPVLGWTATTGATSNICDVYVDQTDDNHVVAVQYGFGGSAKVFETTNGSSFVSKQGNLPIMPVYSCAIDPDDKKHVVIGTEFGIWETMDISVSSPVWREANTGIGRVPIFKLRVNYLRDENCTMLYAGTHGKGFFRTPFPFKTSDICDYTKKARKNTSAINAIQNLTVKFDIYPNPSSDNVNVTFNSKSPKEYSLAIYDIHGKMVKRMNYKAFVGDNIITTDISAMKNGNYIIRLEDNNSVIGGKIMTKQ